MIGSQADAYGRTAGVTRGCADSACRRMADGVIPSCPLKCHPTSLTLVDRKHRLARGQSRLADLERSAGLGRLPRFRVLANVHQGAATQ